MYTDKTYDFIENYVKTIITPLPWFRQGKIISDFPEVQ
jgi:hypothetical protein